MDSASYYSDKTIHPPTCCSLRFIGKCGHVCVELRIVEMKYYILRLSDDVLLFLSNTEKSLSGPVVYPSCLGLG